MAAAVGTHNFSPETIDVRQAGDSSGYFIVERRPSTIAMEFMSGKVQWRVAASTDIGPRILRVGVLPDKGPLGALIQSTYFSKSVSLL